MVNRLGYSPAFRARFWRKTGGIERCNWLLNGALCAEFGVFWPHTAVIDKGNHAIYLVIWRDKYAADAGKDIGRCVRKGAFGFEYR